MQFIQNPYIAQFQFYVLLVGFPLIICTFIYVLLVSSLQCLLTQEYVAHKYSLDLQQNKIYKSSTNLIAATFPSNAIYFAYQEMFKNVIGRMYFRSLRVLFIP